VGQHPDLEVVSLSRLQARCERCAHPNLCALRPQHWLKNLLTFVPLFAAHLFLPPSLVERTLLVFLAFCCCVSSGYLVNDLCDLSADRRHRRKRLRPFASDSRVQHGTVRFFR
jgi:hypothetical protein